MSSALISVRQLDAGLVECGPLRIDFVGGFVQLQGREVALQPMQLRILGYLVRHAGRVVPNEALRFFVFRAVQSSRSTGIARQICVLRRELGSLGALIETVPGGYRFGSA